MKGNAHHQDTKTPSEENNSSPLVPWCLGGSPLRVLAGDCRETLRTVPSESVQCVVTSPPYWGLRDYGAQGQIGLEQSIEDYVREMVRVFDEVKRVLRKDGTCWVNLGDAYAGNINHQDTKTPRGKKNSAPLVPWCLGGESRPRLKSKDLIGLPWRVAFALQASGWFLRSDIIWHKPNPMPESVTDRPTKAHEYLFLLTKSPRYFYDAEAIKDGAIYASSDRTSRKRGEFNGKTNALVGREAFRAFVNLRNKRTVWSVATAPFKGAHFATFPPELIRPCILAGTSAHGCCAACGAPYARVIERGSADVEHQRACGGDVNGAYHGKATKDYASARAQDASATKARILAGLRERKTIAWVPTCRCLTADQRRSTQMGNAPSDLRASASICGSIVVPCTVLDPFGGAFTTAVVALQEGRRAIMCELNAEYIALGLDRCAKLPPKPGVKRRQSKLERRPPAEQLSLIAA